MFGFHLWDLFMVVIMLGMMALVVSLVVWLIRRPTKVIVVMQPPSAQPPYQGPGQPGPYQQPQYPGQPPAQYPPQ